MSIDAVVFQSPIQNCLNDIQHRFYDVQKKICGLCSTDSKVYAFLILGRILQAAALVSFAGSIVFTFMISPLSLIAAIPAIALGALGTYIAGNPQELNDILQISRPFVPGQPVGLINSGNNCWLNSSLQLLVNSPSFHRRMRQIPEFSQFLDAYITARGDYQKVAKNIDTHAIRQFLSRETAGQITDGHVQEDATQFFEYLFEGPNAIYQLEQQIDGAIPVARREPMIQIDLSPSPRPNLQQLFNGYFDCRSNIGQHIQLFFQRAPDDLLIQAKRFYQQVDPISGALLQGKINDRLDVSERLTLSDRFVRSRESQEYFCDGFSIHHGASQDGGHYTSYIKVQNTWWHCSDSTVCEVPARQALDAMSDGYIFHYSRAP
jgi:ubiquitin C-terminal hydrolase